LTNCTDKLLKILQKQNPFTKQHKLD